MIQIFNTVTHAVCRVGIFQLRIFVAFPVVDVDFDVNGNGSPSKVTGGRKGGRAWSQKWPF